MRHHQQRIFREDEVVYHQRHNWHPQQSPVRQELPGSNQKYQHDRGQGRNCGKLRRVCELILDKRLLYIHVSGGLQSDAELSTTELNSRLRAFVNCVVDFNIHSNDSKSIKDTAAAGGNPVQTRATAEGSRREANSATGHFL